MTQSGSPDPRQAAADFIAGLARNSSLSQRAILRQARAAGFRIANDVGRAVVAVTRGLPGTARQRGALLSIRATGVRGALASVQRQVERIVQRRLQEQQQRARVRINYQVSAVVGFVWEDVREDRRVTTVTINNNVTIRADQQQAFERRLPELARTSGRALLDRGLRQLGLSANYGNARFETPPEIRVLSRLVLAR